jgi:putative transposase
VQTLPQRKHLSHTPPSWVKSGEIFFITICCARRKVNQLARDDVFIIMTNALDHYTRATKFWPHIFLAMPDHLHALMSFPSDERMDKVLRDWKRFIAKKAGVVWQDGFFDHRLRSEESFDEKAHYIRTNPVREDLVSEPEAWKYIWSPDDIKR